MMRIFITISLLSLLTEVTAQVNFGKAELDTNITNSKQYKRTLDYTSLRKTGGLNGDWLKWQAWKSEKIIGKKSSSMTPWQNFGPDTTSGRIISVAFHPTDSNTMLVGSASGGLWRTTDYGNTWNVLTDSYFTMGVGAIANNP